jgi:iron complex outermembrane receptor protein
MRLHPGRIALIAGVSFGAFMEIPAVAQETDPTFELDRVVVTAQRRDQDLQDVPVTVTAFGADQIEEARIQQIQDVVTRTPGLSFDAFPASEPRLRIRGVGSSDRGSGGDPSSAVFLDEVYLGRPAAVAFDAFDLERIEVLKGPQGTLFGRNVVGGAINVVTAAPDPASFDASVEGSLGNYARSDVAGFVNVPFADGNAAFRASGAMRKHDGYTDNRTTGGKLEAEDTRSIRLQMLVEPTDAVRFHGTFDSTTGRGTGPGQHVVDLDLSDPFSAFWTVNRDRDFSESEIDGKQDRDTWSFRGQAEWDLPIGTLSYLGSYRELDYASLYDFDGTDDALALILGTDEHSELTSNEVRLSSPSDSASTWVIGVFAYEADTIREETLSLNVVGSEAFNERGKLASAAIFGDITMPVTEDLNVIAGVRYTRDEKTFGITNSGAPDLIRASEFFDVTASDSWNALTWRLGADYHLSPDHMLYAMISRGFKSGGFQEAPSDAAAALDGFDPEYATQYEIGQRSEFLDGRVIWNNTIYMMDYTDLQTRQTVGLSLIVNNAGAATINGYETALQWDVGSGFEVSASYAYTDATFDEFITDNGDFSGNKLSRTPEHKVVVSPTYTYDFVSGASLRFAVDYQHESRIFDDESNLPPEIREPTNFLDARLVYGSSDDKWSASVWGKNLTDEVTRTFQGTFLGANFAAYNPPPTYGVTLRWNY